MSDMTPRPPTREQYIRETYPVAENWQVFRWEYVGESGDPRAAVIVTGAVVLGLWLRGPSKGHPKWATRDKSTEMTVPILEIHFDAWLAKWEAETGDCHKCSGSGQQWAGWSVTEGTKLSPCSRCAATGRAHILAETPNV